MKAAASNPDRPDADRTGSGSCPPASGARGRPSVLAVRQAVIAVVAAALIGGCASVRNFDETRGWSAPKLYAEARDEMNGRNWQRAIKLYETLESRYPFGRYSQQAMLELAYSQWKDVEPVQALATIDRFLKLYPTHPSADYAWYLRGLINFNHDLGVLSSLSRQDVSERDPRSARESFDSFREVVTRFPDSRYAPDAAARMKFVVNMLASNEVHVARFYLRKGAYVAAANRAQTALTTYPQAPANEEGLLIMVKAYDAMGLVDLRNDAERVMRANFPKSKYLASDPRTDGRRWWHLW
ncbi:MAG: outer membrane protein assembly factor BamD [Rhodocyclaceae bacterium]|jgi:outer membrane protein assembly factor BamD|nr:outer membrane protein assembly factor BamD [Rhodocyclaceae bacterium]MCA3076180.1 outer membrane protein assembly factor BamD [Rhodocyclaceae bacterium]MCA3089363.1 outer membrane protein assembly factor BamD [Rhodocyclaceae bacterium]MCA3092924.1 outer membrane protein assembly factor BamD [Rhodocyclaceae bacterium]MCA3096985.1 outer membrane protein assembly factor BamD [Rhodocyclaceae bacterium]